MFRAKLFWAAIILCARIECIEYMPKDMPNPEKNFQICGLDAPGNICDPKNILHKESKAELQKLLSEILSTPTHRCPGKKDELGFSVVVAIIDKMSPEFVQKRNSVTEAAHDFAIELGKEWKVGHLKCSDGAVVFVSVHDKATYIRTAKLTREHLSDYQAKYAISKMTRQFNKEDYDGGLLEGIKVLHESLSAKGEDYSFPFLKLIVPTLLLGFVGFIFTNPLALRYIGLRVIYWPLALIGIPLAYFIDEIIFLCERYLCTYNMCGGRRRGISRSGSEPDLSFLPEDERKNEYADMIKRIREEVNIDEDKDSKICAHCIDPLEDSDMKVIELACGHKFHETCHEAYAYRQNKNQCYICSGGEVISKDKKFQSPADLIKFAKKGKNAYSRPGKKLYKDSNDSLSQTTISPDFSDDDSTDLNEEKEESKVSKRRVRAILESLRRTYPRLFDALTNHQIGDIKDAKGMHGMGGKSADQLVYVGLVIVQLANPTGQLIVGAPVRIGYFQNQVETIIKFVSSFLDTTRTEKKSGGTANKRAAGKGGRSKGIKGSTKKDAKKRESFLMDLDDGLGLGGDGFGDEDGGGGAGGTW
mmetsp:Transcript_17717/g.26533  ORF Transcript_17717/g.26533 Transcript_17717/m.26533 type:complete len:588 (-) Transcript_17717:118-1881(-)